MPGPVALGPPVQLGNTDIETHLAENQDSTIQPGNPAPPTSASIFDQVITSFPDVKLGLSQGIQDVTTKVGIDSMASKFDITGFRECTEFTRCYASRTARGIGHPLTLNEDKEAGSSSFRAGLAAATVFGGQGGAYVAELVVSVVGKGFLKPVAPIAKLGGGYDGGEGGKLQAALCGISPE